MTDGLPQGGPLSPILFNILVGDLAKRIDEKDGAILQYADDTAIVTSAHTWSLAHGRMEKALESVGQYFEDRRIEVNTAKTRIVMFGTKAPKAETVAFRKKYLRIQTEGRYLGIHFTRELRWRKHIRMRVGLARRSMRTLYRVLHNEGLSIRTKTRIVKAIIQPQAMYGEEVWAGASDNDTQKLRGVMREGMLAASGAPWYVRTDLLQQDLGFEEVKRKASAARERMKEKLEQDDSEYRRDVAALLRTVDSPSTAGHRGEIETDDSDSVTDDSVADDSEVDNSDTDT